MRVAGLRAAASQLPALRHKWMLSAALLVAAIGHGSLLAAASDWQSLAKLPDWSGVWTPDVADQGRRFRDERPPWTPAVAQQIAAMDNDRREGRPFLILKGCLPHGMPSLMLITHNALEFLFTPGRVTILGESDGNRLRRIYTDGRSHPEDPDLTFHGHSIGHWEGSTLVVDTVGILPETWIALDEAVGIPNNGGLHVVERIHLQDANTLADELLITAPQVMTAPWRTTRLFHRQRDRRFDIVEGECVQGNFTAGKDANGNSILLPAEVNADGSVVTHRP